MLRGTPCWRGLWGGRICLLVAWAGGQGPGEAEGAGRSFSHVPGRATLQVALWPSHTPLGFSAEGVPHTWSPCAQGSLEAPSRSAGALPARGRLLPGFVNLPSMFLTWDLPCPCLTVHGPEIWITPKIWVTDAQTSIPSLEPAELQTQFPHLLDTSLGQPQPSTFSG